MALFESYERRIKQIEPVMKKYGIKDFDDARKICTDLGFGRTGGYKTLFMSLPRLNVVKIGSNVLLRDMVLNPTSDEQKKVIDDLSDSITKEKRGLAILDGYTINIYGNTDAFQNWTWGNLRNYAKNRGNKGIFRFGLGCTARFLMSMGSTALNFGSHPKIKANKKGSKGSFLLAEGHSAKKKTPFFGVFYLPYPYQPKQWGHSFYRECPLKFQPPENQSSNSPFHLQ